MSNLFLKKFRQSFWHHMLSLKRSLNYMLLAVPPIIYIPDKERILWVLSDDTKIKTNISIKCLFFFISSDIPGCADKILHRANA